MSDLGPEPPDDEALAAEHALGVLTARERAVAEARMARDPSFAAEVDAWRLRLAPLAEEVEAVPPPAGLWTRIERRLAANDNAAGMRRRLRFWRTASLAGVAMSAACMAGLIFMASHPPQVIVQRPPMAPMMNARLMGASGQPLFLAAYDPERKAILVAALTEPRIDPDHSHELWLIPADGKPRSLGMIDSETPQVTPMSEPMAQMTVEGASLAVSIEPRGGSKSAGPSGPVAAIGRLARL